jgi:hypothetical protein
MKAAPSLAAFHEITWPCRKLPFLTPVGAPLAGSPAMHRAPTPAGNGHGPTWIIRLGLGSATVRV